MCDRCSLDNGFCSFCFLCFLFSPESSRNLVLVHLPSSLLYIYIYYFFWVFQNPIYVTLPIIGLLVALYYSSVQMVFQFLCIIVVLSKYLFLVHTLVQTPVRVTEKSNCGTITSKFVINLS